jgi:flagellar biosynthesis/type III secretory pathway protein FliH
MSAAFDRERFLKVLALAESDQDGEALAAIRKASAMARAVGMSLGEAVEEGAEPSATGMLDQIDWLQLNLLRRRVEDLEARLARKLERNAAYQEGRAEGRRDGYERATQDYAQRDAYQEGYRAGHDAGQESERAATNRAYSRGYADGQAAANQNTKPKRKTR